LEKMEEKVKTLKEMFVDLDEDVIRIILNDVGGNTDRAIDNLLKMCMTDTSPPPAEVKKEEKVLSQEEQDILFAKQLQEQLNTVDKEDTDLEFARKLQEELNRAPSYTYIRHEEPEEKFDSTMPISDFLSTVSHDDLKDLVDGVKEQMIPLVVQQLQQVTIPPINQEIDAPKLGPVSFGCDQITLSEVELPSEKVVVNFEGAKIKVNITDISASLKQFSWFYRKEKISKT